MQIKKDYLILLSFFLLVLLLKLPALNMPYEDDEINPPIKSAIDIFHHPLQPYSDYDLNHPPLLYLTLMLSFAIFGIYPWAAHLVIVIFSALALFFTYKLGEYLFNKEVGIISSLLLLFSPAYFAYSSLTLYAIPTAAFTVMAVYFFLKNKKIAFVLSSICLVLIKEYNIFVILGILLYQFIKKNKKSLKNIIYSIIPFLVLGIWKLYHWTQKGKFVSDACFYDPSMELMQYYRLSNLFNITALKTLILMIAGNFVKIVSFIFLFDLFYADQANKFEFFNTFHWLITLIIIFAFIKKKEFFRDYKVKRMIQLSLLILAVHVLIYMFVSAIDLRYFIHLLPFFFIFGGFSIYHLFGKKKYIVLAIILILFITTWTGHNTTFGDKNMEYLDVIKGHQTTANYLSTNYPDAKILTSAPIETYLTFPEGGYIKSPLNVISAHKKGGTGTFYMFNNKINITNIDLVVHNNVIFFSEEIKGLINKQNMTLLKRFERGNKFAEIYTK